MAAPGSVFTCRRVRREALFDSSGGERPSPPALSQQGGGAEGSLIRVAPVRVASGPDKAGAGQYCQMAGARRAWRKGVREEPGVYVTQTWTGSNLADRGRERRAPACGRGTPWLVFDGWPGGHGEVLRGSRGDAAGTEPDSSSVKRVTVNTGTVPVLPAAAHPARTGGLGAPTADRSGTGRSRRSIPGAGEPRARERAAAVTRREGGCNAARRAPNGGALTAQAPAGLPWERVAGMRAKLHRWAGPGLI